MRPQAASKAKAKQPASVMSKPAKDDLITALRSSSRQVQERTTARASSAKKKISKISKSKTKPALKAARSTTRKTKKKKS